MLGDNFYPLAQALNFNKEGQSMNKQKMNKQKMYKKFRECGHDPLDSYRAMQIYSEFKQLEFLDKVKIELFNEFDNYFDVYGEPDTEKERQDIIDQINNLGCFYASGMYKNKREWELADSIGFLIYNRPDDPFDNFQIIYLMDATITAYKEQLKINFEIAKDITIEVWTHLAENIFIMSKLNLPTYLLDKIENDDHLCPLCTLFNIGLSKCSTCPLDADNDGCMSNDLADYNIWCDSFQDDEARSNAAWNIVNKTKNWSV